MAHTVIGVFDTAAEAQRAVQQLEQSGFQRDYVDVAPYNQGSTTSGGYSNSGSTNTTGTRAEAVADDAGDKIGNFFSNLFGGDDDNTSRNYSNVVRSGKSLVTVHARSGEEAERARDLLDSYGAVDVDDVAAQYGGANTSGNAYASTQSTTGQTDETGSVKVMEEQLQVGKRVEQTGGVRVRSRIVERPVEEHLRLREEHVNVERHAVNRPATEADFNAFQEGEIEITESAERAVVGKEARVVEEINLGKEVTEREETIRDTVRKTEVDIEQINNPTTANRTTDNPNTLNRDV
ncbi:YsnF/AvaK domain-containing protein [Hymenobacter radiodurans]|uniref:YsnF/AvaK domain-containing protein n=1 Tax=Hymenobacter radiodurans TaxID=2496028 RepID=UPI001058E694|nr:YsnF/AvaK domain-containing protein [Hymenobacter radiodurans]